MSGPRRVLTLPGGNGLLVPPPRSWRSEGNGRTVVAEFLGPGLPTEIRYRVAHITTNSRPKCTDNSQPKFGSWSAALPSRDNFNCLFRHPGLGQSNGCSVIRARRQSARLHAEVDPAGLPLVGDLDSQGGDEPQERLRVRKGRSDLGTSFDLTIEIRSRVRCQAF